LPEAEGPRQGVVGVGDPFRVLIVGDSSAAGVGVRNQPQALSGHLTRSLAAAAGCELRWRLIARSGITTAQALELVQRERPESADIAVVVLGVNDVVDQVPSHRAVQHRAALADWLLAHTGVRDVVFAPLPPMQRFPLLPQPLRWIAGSDARRHDDAMARWAAGRSGVSHVPIELNLVADQMAADGFHPGEPVYRICGEALARFIADKHFNTKETRT
jgi:lysophospholipase L1-like esterase